MSETYKMVTVVGISGESYEAAIRSAIGDAARTLRQLGWFEVKEMRGRIADGKVAEFQVKIDVGLKVETA